MNRIGSRGAGSYFSVGGLALAVFLFVGTTGAQNPHQRIPMVSDWSHQHVVFSQPTTLDETWRIQRDPRYWMQMISRKARRQGSGGREFERNAAMLLNPEKRHKPSASPFERDWGQSLGVGGSTGVPNPLVALSIWWPVYPAKFSFDISAAPDCTNDFVVFPTNLAGMTGGQASVIAYNKLYAGSGSPFCGVANPAVDWSYNTNLDAAGLATTGTVQTSPVLAGDGSKVAFVETRAIGAILHLLKWHAGDGSAINSAAAPNTATRWTADGLASHCPVSGSCMISIALNGLQADSGSSPFYDYQRDVIYVGDDNSACSSQDCQCLWDFRHDTERGFDGLAH